MTESVTDTSRSNKPGAAINSDELASPGPSFDIRDAFGLRQTQLLATLGLGRSIGGHPVAIGDSSELNWRGMLETILPTRYRVSKAFAVDARGSKSEQIDLLIYDRHFSPVLVDVGEYPFVPAEAVYAVLEIKQDVDSDSVDYASRKVASVRRLHRTSASIYHAGGTFEPRAPQRIIGGLLASSSSWKAPLPVAVRPALDAQSGEGSLDLICALSAGTVEVRDPEGMCSTGPESSLIFFVLRLLHRLQQLASVPAIDYAEYSRVLEEDR